MLKCLIIASIFWFNPLISNIDVLPDIVGYLLVLKAFSKASYVYDYASDVCSSAKKMCIITGVKLFTIVMVSSLDITMSLLLSFSFALIEAIFGIPFFIKLFTALMYLVPVENKTAHEREGKIKIFTIGAFVTRLVLAMLPDLTALSLDSAFTNDTDYSYLRFRPLFIIFSAIISLIVSVIWLIMIIRFFKKAVTTEVTEKCNVDFLNRAGNNKSLLSSKNSMRAVVLTAVGSLFIFDFTWEYTNVDIFEDFVFTALAVLALLFLAVKRIYKMDKLFLGLVGVLAVHIAVNAFEMNANIDYFEKYNVDSILKVSKAEDMYFWVCVSAVLSSLVLVGASFLILLIMKKNARENITKHSTLFSEIDINYYLNEFDRRANRNIIIATAISVIYAVIYSLSVILKPYAEWMTLLNIVFEIAYIISFINASLYVHDEVYKRILIFS